MYTHLEQKERDEEAITYITDSNSKPRWSFKTISCFVNCDFLINNGYDCNYCGGFTRECESESVVILV